jgi:hypothetical protein
MYSILSLKIIYLRVFSKDTIEVFVTFYVNDIHVANLFDKLCETVYIEYE